ncbi:MAG: CRTAC1 family protein, partial [Planctomycetes bacterium]|nr:CRTAC1 family protein [Planctomycetota bacterium]
QNFTLVGGGRAYGRPQDFLGTFPYLYRNDGEGRFTDVSAEAGVQVVDEDTGSPVAKSLGVTFDDFDRDGRLDIAVANDTVRNFLFKNLGNCRFEEIGRLANVAFDPAGNARGAMGIDAARFRNSDSVGIAIGNFANEMTALYVASEPEAGLLFKDEAVSNGLGPVTRQELTFGLFFFDADLDGRLDLLASNGHLEEDINKVQPSQHYEQPPQLLWNAGAEHRTEFVPVPPENCGRDFVRPLVGRGATYADIDGDGDLDVLIVAGGGPPRLLRNDQSLGRHWLRVKLVGRKGAAEAIGAEVEVHAGGKVFAQRVMPTCSYLSQVELPLTFGLGEQSQVDRLRVHWPDGSVTEIESPAIDALKIVEAN